MSLRKSPEISDGFLAASRSNGSKSKGPKTEEGKRRSSQNSYKHGLYAAPDSKTRQLMLRVGEDPDLLARLEREFKEALQPANAMEAMIVADIAKLYRDKALLEKSVRAMRLEQAEFKVECAPIDEEQLQAVGYLGVPNSIQAFNQAHALLDHLMERVERRQWAVDDDLNRTLGLLGGNPLESWSEEARLLFEEAASLNPESDQKAVDAKKNEIAGHIRLKKADLYEEENEYRQARSEEITFELGSMLVPGNRKWSTVLKQQARLDRMIVSKVRLLNLVRRECRRKAAGGACSVYENTGDELERARVQRKRVKKKQRNEPVMSMKIKENDLERTLATGNVIENKTI